jgi:hypothetical protein
MEWRGAAPMRRTGEVDRGEAMKMRTGGYF